MARPAHLVSRFFGSLRPGGPSSSERAWVAEVLEPAELELWERMSGPDRRHSAAVARRVERALGHEATDEVLAAALLHDVGKVQSRLRTYGRVVATLSAAVAGRETAALWVRSRGFVRRVGLYIEHPSIGGDLIEVAGGRPMVAAWAREHHGPREEWTIPAHFAEALDHADDD